MVFRGWIEGRTRICSLGFDIETDKQGETASTTSTIRVVNLAPLLLFASKAQEGEMRSKQIAEDPKTVVVILDTGDEILSSLKSVARTEHLAGSSFKAIGALSDVELGWFNWETKKYETALKFQEQVELLSLIGDIALKDNEPQVHAHLVIGRQDGTAHGGHLLSATVRPTCEIVITESPQHLQKEIDPESGIALIRL
jgi:predicted DNA-binding protein with PD1-like motif